MINKLLIFGLLGMIAVSSLAAKKDKVKAATSSAKILNVDTVASVVNWKGTKVTGTHNGKIKIKSGSLEVSNGALSGGTVEMDMASIVNEDLTDAKLNEKLIGHLSSDDFFGVAKNPTATLKINSIKDLKKDSTYEVSGDLMIKGKSNPISFPAKIDIKDGALTASATVKVDRTKYDIKYGSGKFFENLGDKMIHDEFELSFDLKTKI